LPLPLPTFSPRFLVRSIPLNCRAEFQFSSTHPAAFYFIASEHSRWFLFFITFTVILSSPPFSPFFLFDF
jgi:hypothetical protein